MKKFYLGLLTAAVLALQILPAGAAYKEKTDLNNATGVLGEAHGGTGATSLGDTISEANDVLNVSQPSKIVLTSTYTVLAADSGYILSYEGISPSTFELPSAVSAGFTAGFAVTIVANGAQDVTIDPTGSTINGAGSLLVPAGTGCLVYSNGADFEVDLSACSAINSVSVPGSNHQVVYNNNGVLGATSLLTIDSTVRATAPLEIGTPSVVDTGILLQATANTNSYAQAILQNTNVGSSASADLVIGGSNMTSTAHYLDLGFNGANGGGAPYTAANAAYLYTTDNELNLGAHGASGVINLATGATPTTRMTVGTSTITQNLPTTISNTLTLGGVLNWSTGLGAINTITGPTDQNLKIQAGTPGANTSGRGLTFATTNGVSPNFGSAVNGGDVSWTTGNGVHNSSNGGGRGGDFTILLGNANSFARGGQFSLTTGNGDALGSSQNGAGGSILLTTGTGATSNTATGYAGGRGGDLTFTGGIGGVNTGTSNAAGQGGGVTMTGGVGGTASGSSGGTGGKGGSFAFNTAAGGNATGGSGTRTGGAGGDFEVGLGAGGTGASANGRAGRFGINTGTAPQARVDFNVGAMLVRGGTAPTISSCGTSPSVTGSSSSFKVVMGSGTLTACTINFGEGFSTAPQSCTITPADATAAATGTTGAYVSAISTTQVTITGLNLTDADYYVQCF